MRYFIAIDIPDELKEEIREFQKTLPFGLKLVKPENIHITLKFLGDVDEKEIISKLEGIEIEQFESKTIEIGFFPKKNYARVIWLGLEDNEITDIVRKIETRLNLTKEDFIPHITIARSKIPLRNLEINFKPEKTIKINKITLYSSELTPKGPIYKKVVEF